MIHQKRSIGEWLVRSVILMAGLTVAHFGVTLFILSNFGSDPYNVLIQGIYRSTLRVTGWEFLTHGRTHMAISLLIILLLLLIDRSYIKIGTVLCMLCGGPIIDFFTMVLRPVLSEESPVGIRVLMLVMGCGILAFGMTVVIKSDAGTGPNDLVAVVFSDKMKTKFSWTRLTVDAVFALAGFLFGGQVGAGTIVCAALVGPIAGFFMPVSERIVRKILACMGNEDR